MDSTTKEALKRIKPKYANKIRKYLRKEKISNIEVEVKEDEIPTKIKNVSAFLDTLRDKNSNLIIVVSPFVGASYELLLKEAKKRSKPNEIIKCNGKNYLEYGGYKHWILPLSQIKKKLRGKKIYGYYIG